MASSCLALCLLLSRMATAGGFLESTVVSCVFNSSHVQEFVQSYRFNRVEYISFSSRARAFVGYTALGLKTAAAWNAGPQLDQALNKKDTYCRYNADIDRQAALRKSVEPYVVLSSMTPPGGQHPALLVCSVYDFYPKQIRVSWQRDGHEVTSEVTSTEELADGDWYYQVHSHLEYTPRSGEKISCVVEHASLKEPLIKDWNPSLPESERNKIAIGASGLILGLILSLAGFIYYKRKVKGTTLVPTEPSCSDL